MYNIKYVVTFVLIEGIGNHQVGFPQTCLVSTEQVTTEYEGRTESECVGRTVYLHIYSGPGFQLELEM